MTTLTMRVVKGDFIVTGPDIAPMKFKSRAGGARLVQDAPSRLAHHRDRSRRQARSAQEAGATGSRRLKHSVKEVYPSRPIN